MTQTIFPDDFLWGAATAAYQIEGSPLADGAGASIWQRFSHDPRLMAAKGDTGDVACDHYNRMPADVALMKELGLKAYRFSVNWGRVLPEGIGRSEEHTSELQSLMRISYAVFCLKKKKHNYNVCTITVQYSWNMISYHNSRYNQPETRDYTTTYH